MHAIIETAGALALAGGLGFAALALWTHGYLSRRRWSGFALKAGAGSLCGGLSLCILVVHFGGSWGDVLLAAAIVAAVFAGCWGLMAVLDL